MTLQDWLVNIIEKEKPDNTIIAYYFGLFETENGYTIYLSGSKEFDPEDSDWAVNDDFSPSQKYFTLPSDYKNLGWEEVQAKIALLLTTFFESEAFKRSFLINADAIACGFDDGDLIRLK